MKMFYIASPLGAKGKDAKEKIKENMKNAKRYAKEITELTGVKTIAPHSFLPEYLDDTIPEQRALGLHLGIEILKACDAIVVCGERISPGMEAEIKLAQKENKPVYCYYEDLDGNWVFESFAERDFLWMSKKMLA